MSTFVTSCSDKQCSDPHAPSTAADNGGDYSWTTGSTAVYPFEVTYTCKSSREFEDGTTMKKIHCQWNKLWNDTTVRKVVNVGVGTR